MEIGKMRETFNTEHSLNLYFVLTVFPHYPHVFHFHVKLFPVLVLMLFLSANSLPED